MKLFYNYSIDCELPPDGTFGGPATWEVAEASTRGFIEAMDAAGLRAAASLFVYPDVALRQRALFREMADAGIEIALHLHAMRYSRMNGRAWLGALPAAEQRLALRMARADVEDVIGRPVLGFRACYASAGLETFHACQEEGFLWTSTTAAGTWKPEIASRWTRCWPFPYHPHERNRLIPGGMRIYEMPATRGIRTLFQGNPDRPLDMRAETPPEIAGPQAEVFRAIIEENLEEMGRVEQPVRLIAGASHNTNPFADRASHQRRNLDAIGRHARDCAAEKGYDFVPASFFEIMEEAGRINAF